MEVRLADDMYWKEQIKCQAACPVQTDARGYVRAIAEGKDDLAYLIARGPNPLASICGRVCGAPCETACRRGSYDKPIAIRALKRYVCEQFGPESQKFSDKTFIEFLKDAAKGRDTLACAGEDELLPLLQSLMKRDIPQVSGKSVGIIGSGPAGLAAAHDLALLGFDVTIYEMEPLLAGMLIVGVPQYRLGRDVIQAEVGAITEMGVKARTNCRVGKDISFAELRQQHDAVVVAVGAKNSRRLPVPGMEAAGVIGGVEFLRDLAVGNPAKLGSRIVVIGGGNVAFDVGRTVLRQVAMDAARTALRSPGVHQVHLCSLESLEEMPADDIEIIEGDEEGIIRCHSYGPKEILTDTEGHVTGVRLQRCLRVFDEQKRFSPMFDENDLLDIPCDNVLVAIGQSFDLSFIDAARDGLALRPNGMIECNPDDGTTNASDVFVAGDLAYGPKLLIHAVASGKAVARAIYQQVTGTKISYEDTVLHFPEVVFDREQGYEKIGRVKLPTIPVEERLKSHEHIVEKGYVKADARREASRCLNCGVNTIFDGERCVLCGGCVDVCPVMCLQIMPTKNVATTEDMVRVVESELDEDNAQASSVIIKDEMQCIRCGLCANRCPTGAITMESFKFQEVPKCLNV